MKLVTLRLSEWGCRLPQVHCYGIFGRGITCKILAFTHKKKSYFYKAASKTDKKTRNGNLLVEMKSRRQAESIVKMKTFHSTKCRAISHEKPNTSKGVIGSKKFAFATEKERALALGKQRVTNVRRISVRKGEGQIQTKIYILTFNQPHTPKEVKISYCIKRFGQYVPVPLRYYKCEKYGHHKETYWRRHTWAKCSEKDPGHLKEDCSKQIRYINSRQDHLAYVKSCDVYKKGKEIREVKQEECVLFGSKKNCRDQHGRKQLHLRRVVTTNQDNKNITPMKKLFISKANDWLKFQEYLKKLYSAEFYQTPAQQRLWKGERSDVVDQTLTHVGPTTTTRTTLYRAKSPTKQPLHKSPIRPPKSIKIRHKNLSPIKPEQLDKNRKLPFAKLGKYRWTPKWTMKDQEAHSKYSQEQSRL